MTVAMFSAGSIAMPRASRAVTRCAAAKEAPAQLTAQGPCCPVPSSTGKAHSNAVLVQGAKEKCVHPNRPIRQACADCPRRAKSR
jgi:hypothetical protein